MSATLWTRPHENRCVFISGSDARTIMGRNDAAERLSKKKRNEVPRGRLFGNLTEKICHAIEQLNEWNERTATDVIKNIQTRVPHAVVRWMATTLEGITECNGVVLALIDELGTGSSMALFVDASSKDGEINVRT